MGKGHTNNPNGRPKGKPNQITLDLREELKGFLSKQWSEIGKDLKSVTPAERLRFFERLLPYIIPKLQTVEYRNEDAQLLNSLSTEQIDQLYNLIIQKQPHEDNRTETR